MTNPSLGAIQAVFHGAADLPPADRRAYLDRACGSDGPFRETVERLLAADAAETWFTPPTPAGGAADAGAGDPPATVGEYRVVRTIGRGGSGIVYEAEQQNPRRRVAVKVLRAGVGSAAQSDWLGREAHILGQLRHPGIAQVYEAGVDAGGRPFFAMELVAERTLTAYAAAAGLPVGARARLVADVCDAVHHAHENRIVHLDLKPANVLVDDAGRAKVLDFGVARLAGAGHEAMAGASGLPVGTPAYMSPEQLAGATDVDRRADVYAIGVVLCELLVGRVPADRGAAIRLPGVPRRYRRDLAAIAGRATAADPGRRYPTAAAVAADLRRCLDRRPVAARPPTATYVGRRFVRRHRALTLGMATTAAVLVAGAVVSGTFAVRADRARRSADVQRHAAERNLYVADVRLAREAVTAGRVGDAARLLDDAVGGDPAGSDLRGWEWEFLDRLAHPVSDVLEVGPGTDVRAVTASPDGRLFACTGGDRRVHVWAARGAGRPPVERFALDDATAAGFGLAFSPDGTRLAAGTWDGRVLVWDTASGGRVPGPADRPEAVVGVAFGPAGRWLAVARHRTAVEVYEAATGRLVFARRPAGDWVSAVAVSRSGGRLATLTGDGVVTAWAVAGGDGPTPVTAGDPVVWRVDRGWASAMAMSPDGRQAAVASADGTVTIADAVDGHAVLTIPAHDGWALAVGWSSDGTRLVTGGRDGWVRTWDAATGARLGAFAGHENWVYAAAFGPGSSLLSGGRAADVRVWRAGPADGTEAAVTPTPPGSTALAVHPDGRRVAVGDAAGVVRVWDDGPAGSPRVLPGSDEWVMGLAGSPDGRWLAAAGRDHTVRIWPWAADRPGDPPAGPRVLAGHGDWAEAVAFSPDSARLAAGGRDGTVRIWDVATGTPVRTVRIGDDVVSIAFSPDGRRLACAGLFPHPCIVDLAVDDDRCRVRLPEHTQGATAIAFAPDGLTVATGSDDETVRVWDAGTGRPVAVCRGHTNAVAAVAFSPDGRRLASAGADHVVRVWDPATGRELCYVRGPTQPVTGLAFCPDGSRILSVGDEAGLFTWTAEKHAGDRGRR